METVHRESSGAALTALEAAAASARGGFACMFSTSHEYETALITERRAQGRYRPPRRRWVPALFMVCALAVAVTVVLLS